MFSIQIEGTFRLDSPAVLLGYTRDTGKKKSESSGVGDSEHSYVSLFMTIEPSLGVAPEVKETVRIMKIHNSKNIFLILFAVGM